MTKRTTYRDYGLDDEVFLDTAIRLAPELFQVLSAVHQTRARHKFPIQNAEELQAFFRDHKGVLETPNGPIREEHVSAHIPPQMYPIQNVGELLKRAFLVTRSVHEVERKKRFDEAARKIVEKHKAKNKA